jgi:hypothetical protein
MKKNQLIGSLAALTLLTAASFNAIKAETTPVDAESNPNHSMKRWVYPESAKKELSNKAEQTVAWMWLTRKKPRNKTRNAMITRTFRQQRTALIHYMPYKSSLLAGKSRP